MTNRIKIIILSTFLLFILYGCPNSCKPEIIDNGSIAQQYKNCIPYQDGQIYKLKHSGGLVINFTTSRKQSFELTELDFPCSEQYKYEKVEVYLKPDYPISDIYLHLSNYSNNGIVFSIRIFKWIS